MEFDKRDDLEGVCKRSGFVFSYFVFTTILFFILGFFQSIPSHWTYFHVMGITLIVVFTGLLIKRFLQ